MYVSQTSLARRWDIIGWPNKYTFDPSAAAAADDDIPNASLLPT